MRFSRRHLIERASKSIAIGVLLRINPIYAQIGMGPGHWRAGAFAPILTTQLVIKTLAGSGAVYEAQTTQLVIKALAGSGNVYEAQTTQLVTKVLAGSPGVYDFSTTQIVTKVLAR